MLQNLHVKNLALIDETEVDFRNGLNILSGETGAGKSIIIGSINLALGEKVQKEMLRENADYALVELIFSVTDEKQKELLRELDVFPENDEVILSRKIVNGRGVAKVNAVAADAYVCAKSTGVVPLKNVVEVVGGDKAVVPRGICGQ